MAKPGRWADLAEAIHQAVTWADLEEALDSAQRAYERRELLREQIEALAIEAAAMARILPEQVDAKDPLTPTEPASQAPLPY